MQTFLWLAATGLVVASSCRLLVGGLRHCRHESLRRECHAARRRQLNSESQLAQRASELADNPLQPGVGWRVLEVAAVVEESADVKSFYLTDPYDRPLPDFLPGQHIMVRPAWAGTYQATRCYSLSMAPNARCWRIAVKRQPLDSPPPRTRKTGALSHWLHAQVGRGDCLLVNGPGGQFHLVPERQGPLVLLAAGVGITPLCSILHHALAQTPTRSLSLYYQASDLQHWPLGREVHSQCQQPNVHVVTYFSRTTEDKLLAARQLPGEFRLGYIDVQAVIRETDTEAAHYYMCGPESWMEGLRQQLTDAGVPLEQIHWESFGGTAPAFQGSPTEPCLHRVHFARSAIQAQWTDPELTLWELAQSQDVIIPSGCLSGVCGTCRVRVLAGRFRYDRSIHVELAQNECLACVARPTSDLALDV